MTDATDNAVEAIRANAAVVIEALVSAEVDKATAPLHELLNRAVSDMQAAQAAEEDAIGRLEVAQNTISDLRRQLDEALHPKPPVPPFVIGAAWEGSTDPTALEQRLGKTLAVHRTYYAFTDKLKALAVVEADFKAGRVPFISFKLPGSWADVAAGAYDETWVAAISSSLEALGAKYGKPIYLTLHHEPEGDGTQAAWKAMLAHCRPLMSSAHVKFGAVLQGFHSVPNVPAGTNPGAANDWPIASVIPSGLDFVAFDPYETYMNKDQKPTWRNWDAWYAYLSGEVAKLGVPEWGIAEIGVTLPAYTAKPSWFSDNIALAKKHGAGFWLYFDSNAGGSTSTWRMDKPTTGAKGLGTPDAREAAFAAALKGQA